MGVQGQSEGDVRRQNWPKICKHLGRLLGTKQEQLEYLIKERKVMQDRMNMQHERWVSDTRVFEDRLSQMERELESVKLERSYEAAKWSLLTGLLGRGAFVCKLKLDHAEDELEDFKAWFHFLTQNSNISLKSPTTADIVKSGGKDINFNIIDRQTLESETRKLKAEIEKLALEKNTEVSLLLRENRFVWTQYERMEEELTNKLTSKSSEVEQANEKILGLISREEQLQSSNHEKDEIIQSLKDKVAEMEADASKRNEEISKLAQELESLRKNRSASVTPLGRCTTRRNGNKDGSNNLVVKKELPVSDPAQSEKVSRNSKRKRLDGAQVGETPKLFTSAFKVPKLKISSPQTILL